MLHGRAVPLRTVAREWTRIGLIGFGGPPAHIGLLRQLVVDRRGWLDASTFEDANAACGMLPGPASTQLAILCAYRVAGPAGAVVGGLGFIVPAVVLILAASAFVLVHSPPLWVLGAGAGAGAAVAAVAVRAGLDLVGPSRARVSEDRRAEARWWLYLLAGLAAAALIGPYLVIVLLLCGTLELLIQRGPGARAAAALAALRRPHLAATGGTGALAFTAFKVGALSFGGGFVIIPLMQGDAVHVHHWMTNQQFLDAVALGQITPGPVVATVAAVGYAARGLGGGVLASAIAFAPSFAFVLLGGRQFERFRTSLGPRAFLDGAGPAAIGAILGAAITLTGALGTAWQFGVLAAAAVSLIILRLGIVSTLVAAAVLGAIVVVAGAPLP